MPREGNATKNPMAFTGRGDTRQPWMRRMHREGAPRPVSASTLLVLIGALSWNSCGLTEPPTASETYARPSSGVTNTALSNGASQMDQLLAQPPRAPRDGEIALYAIVKLAEDQVSQINPARLTSVEFAGYDGVRDLLEATSPGPGRWFLLQMPPADPSPAANSAITAIYQAARESLAEASVLPPPLQVAANVDLNNCDDPSYTQQQTELCHSIKESLGAQDSARERAEKSQGGGKEGAFPGFNDGVAAIKSSSGWEPIGALCRWFMDQKKGADASWCDSIGWATNLHVPIEGPGTFTRCSKNKLAATGRVAREWSIFPALFVGWKIYRGIRDAPKQIGLWATTLRVGLGGGKWLVGMNTAGGLLGDYGGCPSLRKED